MRKKVAPRLVCIHWHDHQSSDDLGWKNPKELSDTPADCLSVGWVIKETKTAIVIASSWNKTEVDGDVTIIKKAIVNLWELPDPSLEVRNER